jgi:trehalose synthase-fused probable maltokinase
MTFADTLARWLPTQRWYSGQNAAVGDLAITSDVTLTAGDPEFRHLVITVSKGGQIARYQVLAGFRSRLPVSLSHAVIGPAEGGMTAYDALHDPALTSILLHNIASQRSVGPLRFSREPGAPIDNWADSRVLAAEQSNTSLVFGEAAILKVLRRPFPGENPDLEVAGALARRGSTRVAAPLGWIETHLDGEPTLLGVLSRYLPGASDGWSLAVSGLRSLYAELAGARPGDAGDYLAAWQGQAPEQDPGSALNGTQASVLTTAHADIMSGGPVGASGMAAGASGMAAGASAMPGEANDTGAPGAMNGHASALGPRAEADPHFTGEAYLLGQATAEMHADLAAAFGTGELAPRALTQLADDMTGKLAEALDEVPELGRHAAKLRAAFSALGEITSPVTIQRVHGDFHLGQVIATQAGWVALDFEGEPAIPLAQRRARYPALKDVAGMLRSFDYAARHPLLGNPDAQRLRPAAEIWVERCQTAFCAGYARAGGTDPVANAALLRALMLEKAVYEVVYESRQRPAWLSIPLDSIAAS